MKSRSKRFTRTRWTEYVVPVVLLLLLLTLIATLLMIVLAALATEAVPLSVSALPIQL